MVPTAPSPAVQPAQPHDYAIYFTSDVTQPPAIAAFHVSTDGSTEAIHGSPFAGRSGTGQLFTGTGGNFLFANTYDFYEPDTGVLGPNRGIYVFKFAPDGSLSAPTRLTQTYFPVSLSASGSTLYVGQANQETFGYPIALSVYSVDPVSGQITLQPNSGITVAGQETFDGQPSTTQNGLWIKTGNVQNNTHAFLHFATDRQSGAVMSPTQLTTDAVDMYSTMLAESEHFLLVRDGDFHVQPVFRTYSVQNGQVTHLQDCPLLPTCFYAHAVIHPSERFAFLLSSSSVFTVPLDLNKGFRFDLATSVPLAPTSPNTILSALAMSEDGKLLAVARTLQLDIFSISEDGTLMPIKGSPFQMPISDPNVMTIALLPPQ